MFRLIDLDICHWLGVPDRNITDSFEHKHRLGGIRWQFDLGEGCVVHIFEVETGACIRLFDLDL